MDWNSMKYALLGGIVWNFGNIFLTAAIAVAGMSVGFPIGGGLAWIGGIIFNYLLISLAGEVYPGNQTLLWIGVAVIVIAICICGKAYGKMSASQASTPKKGILLAIVAGLAIMFFYGLVVKSLNPQYVTGGTGTLTPYTGVFCFAAGVLITTPVFNTFAMSHPAQGNKVTMKDYLKGDTRTHLIGMLGGFIWMSGMVVSFRVCSSIVSLSNVIVPPSAFSKKFRQRRSVVFPDPLGPRIAITSPLLTERLIS